MIKMKTKEKLALALKEAGAPENFIKRAEAGYYDDFESPLATAIIQLVTDLRVAGLDKLAQRAIDGEFDGTKEEGEEWFNKEGKTLI
jgi:hypothetical protein